MTAVGLQLLVMVERFSLPRKKSGTSGILIDDLVVFPQSGAVRQKE
jgi:hypothetical protein